MTPSDEDALETNFEHGSDSTDAFDWNLLESSNVPRPQEDEHIMTFSEIAHRFEGTGSWDIMDSVGLYPALSPAMDVLSSSDLFNTVMWSPASFWGSEFDQSTECGSPQSNNGCTMRRSSPTPWESSSVDGRLITQ
jgi:hypothetical protein